MKTLPIILFALAGVVIADGINSSAAFYDVGTRRGFGMVGDLTSPLVRTVGTRTDFAGQIFILFGYPRNSGADSDQDGIPDWWEDRYGLAKWDADDATASTDSKGMTPIQHFTAGTDPTDESSFPSIAVSEVQAGLYKLRWLAAEGRRYRIYKTTDITLPPAEWEELLPAVDGSGQEVEVSHEPDVDEPMAFFRFLVERITE